MDKLVELVNKLIELIKNNKIISILVLIIVVGLIILLNIKTDNNPNHDNDPIIQYKIELFGNDEVIITQGEEYIEPGYYALYGSEDVTDEVIVIGSVNANKPGTYQITYSIKDIKKTRTIKVIKKEQDEEEEIIDNSKLNFKLIGDEVITLKLNQVYKEPGVLAVDSNGNNLVNKVKIKNQINLSRVGTYYVTYTLEYNNKIYELRRKVIVIEPLKIVINYNKMYASQVVLNIKVTGSNYKFLKLPDQTVTNSNSSNYKIVNNGTYTFYAYDDMGNYVTESVVISNIDNKVDSASCVLNVKLKSSEIVINASDLKSGINYYHYNGSNYTTNKITVNKKLDSASVIVLDKAGNSKTINCQVNIQESMYGFILIGDSRFVMMESYLGSSKRSNDTIVAKVSMGYNWLIDTAIDKVNSILEANPDKKYYIFSNLGINDYSYRLKSPTYGSKLSELANGIWKDHVVGYISVNPYASVSDTRNKKVEEFNNLQKSALNNVYYCDTYNGLGVSNFKSSSSSDVLHYNKETSINIYNYIINNCAF